MSLLEEFLHEGNFKRLAGFWVTRRSYKTPTKEDIIGDIFEELQVNLRWNKNDNDYKKVLRRDLTDAGFIYVESTDPVKMSYWENPSHYRIFETNTSFVFYIPSSAEGYHNCVRLPYQERFFKLAKELIDNPEILCRLAKRVELEGRLLREK